MSEVLLLIHYMQCWNWPKRTGGSAAEMFEILPRDWSLWPIFTQKWAFVDMNWGFNPPTPLIIWFCSLRLLNGMVHNVYLVKSSQLFCAGSEYCSCLTCYRAYCTKLNTKPSTTQAYLDDYRTAKNERFGQLPASDRLYYATSEVIKYGNRWVFAFSRLTVELPVNKRAETPFTHRSKHAQSNQFTDSSSLFHTAFDKDRLSTLDTIQKIGVSKWVVI